MLLLSVRFRFRLQTHYKSLRTRGIMIAACKTIKSRLTSNETKHEIIQVSTNIIFMPKKIVGTSIFTFIVYALHISIICIYSKKSLVRKNLVNRGATG